MRASWKYITAVLLVGTLATPAQSLPIIDWDPVYFYDPAAPLATPTNSPPGNELRVVGTISQFGPPLDDLNPFIGTRDYTIFITGLIAGATTTFGPPGTRIFLTPYTGGVISIYEGLVVNADFGVNPENATVPSTFTDGETLLLQGTMSNLVTQTNDFSPHQVGFAESAIIWTGGSRFADVQDCPALFTGGLTWNNEVKPEGYLFRHDGKIDRECPTPTQPSTWGRIKSLYR